MRDSEGRSRPAEEEVASERHGGPQADSDADKRIPQGRAAEMLLVKPVHAPMVGENRLGSVGTVFQIVDDGRLREVDDLISCPTCPEAPVDIFAEKEEPFIQKSDRLAGLSTDSKEGTGNPVDFPSLPVAPVA